VNLLGNGIYALLSHPGELNRLKQQPDLLESAVEEFLRYESPIQIATRLPAIRIEGEAPLWREDNNLRSLRSLRLRLDQSW
jgi:hypothetical protein